MDLLMFLIAWSALISKLKLVWHKAIRMEFSYLLVVEVNNHNISHKISILVFCWFSWVLHKTTWCGSPSEGCNHFNGHGLYMDLLMIVVAWGAHIFKLCLVWHKASLCESSSDSCTHFSNHVERLVGWFYGLSTVFELFNARIESFLSNSVI